MRKRDGFEIFLAILKKTLHKSKIRVQYQMWKQQSDQNIKRKGVNHGRTNEIY